MGSVAEPALSQLRGRLLAALVGQPGIDPERDLRVRMPGERGDLRGAQTLLESDCDERMAKVVQPDGFAPVAVQPDLVARAMNGAEQVSPRLRLFNRQLRTGVSNDDIETLRRVLGRLQENVA